MKPETPEYVRPTSLEEALELLGRKGMRSIPLAGGTHLALYASEADALIDLAGLGLRGIRAEGERWHVGSMTALEDLMGAAGLQAAIRRAARREANRNLRSRATVGGTIVVGESGPLILALLAADASVSVEPGRAGASLSDWLAEQGGAERRGNLLTEVVWDRSRRIALAEVSRTPADHPIVCVALGAGFEAEGLSRVVLACGCRGQPIAVEVDAADALEGARGETPGSWAQSAARNLKAKWRDDIRASAEYRRAMVPILLGRALQEILSES